MKEGIIKKSTMDYDTEEYHFKHKASDLCYKLENILKEYKDLMKTYLSPEIKEGDRVRYRLVDKDNYIGEWSGEDLSTIGGLEGVVTEVFEEDGEVYYLVVLDSINQYEQEVHRNNLEKVV